MKRSVSIFVLIIHIFLFATGQEIKQFTLENIYKEALFYPARPDQVQSMKDGEHYTVIKNDSLNIYKYRNGEFIKTLITRNSLPKNNDGSVVEINNYSFNNDESKILIAINEEPIYRHSTKSVYLIYYIETKSVKPLIDNTTKVQLATFSPGGDKVSYVFENNIYIKDLSSNETTQVTETGETNKIINGTCDWVYEEEFGFTKAYFWSPGEDYIAYYVFDESDVNQFTITFYNDEIYPELYTYKYPKPGEDNSIVEIHFYNLKNKEVVKADLGSETDIYFPRIKWSETKKSLAVQRLNRLQNKLDILLVDAGSGQSKIIYSEENPYYIEITDSWTFIPGQEQFIITSEKDGYNHIYLYNMDGSINRQLTKGQWDVIELLDFNAADEVVYYISAETSPLNRDLYAVRLDGYKTRISQREGYNNATFNDSYKYYINTWSDANTPPRYTVNKANGKELRILEANSDCKSLLHEYGYSNKEFFNFTTTDGIKLNGWMIKPDNFNPENEYPVMIYVYGGPGSQTVMNAWNNRNPWYELLAQHGIIVVSVDNRGTGARGQDFKKLTYQQLGKYETIDQIEAAKYLISLGFIDANRIAIFGWSYGGFMSTLAMTVGADYFDVGIAVAPVTHYKYYDNIYTEKYMRTPQTNPEGYNNNSPIKHVDKLKGQYLLIHGSADDNVHYQNSMELVNALIEAGKQFDLMIYPNKNHFIYGGNTTYHLYTKMTEFLLKNLKTE